ncbi:uncharacterized protein LAJ45_01327 [Morchella importuna]|uniref:uncharacterized protein n=1 Tax=Morchella importuna TaxID=1174673 RepID=UPI001E8EC9B7|nr:uncharacterized protein LAJ45_01327 [Morchella importuna]KAH8154796.1 hypothetical protein LAJ45_01327 [Morchella importuna]
MWPESSAAGDDGGCGGMTVIGGGEADVKKSWVELIERKEGRRTETETEAATLGQRRETTNLGYTKLTDSQTRLTGKYFLLAGLSSRVGSRDG